MIRRTYFVSYAGKDGLIGSLHLTSKSWFEMPDTVFNKAVEFLALNHAGCVITSFHRI